MWQYNELAHFGVRGMKWGERRALRKTVDTQHRNLVKRYDYKDNGPDASKMRKHLSEAKRLAGKYDFDQDDGGGGRTKKDQEAGRRYMDHLEKAEHLQAQIHNRSVTKANTKIANQYTNDELKQIGRDYINKYRTTTDTIVNSQYGKTTVDKALAKEARIKKQQEKVPKWLMSIENNLEKSGTQIMFI